MLWWGCCLSGSTQTLPAERTTDWSRAGTVPTEFPDGAWVDFQHAGGFADGVTPNDAVISRLLDSLRGVPAVLYFPPGTYRFERPLVLRDHLILRGASAAETRLRFALQEEKDLISVTGKVTADTAALTADAAQGDRRVHVTASARFQPGDYVYLSEDDARLVTSEWARGETGQVVQISAIQGNVLVLASPLRRPFAQAYQAQLQRWEPVQYVGIEQLALERLDATKAQTSNLHFQYAAHCWVTCVESINGNFAHITASHSTQLEISGSYLHNAFAYGGGGQGYGVMLQFATGECLVHNNVFRHLRHAMILQAGANGNVLAYNYSREPYWDDPFLPTNAAGDLVLHGNYPYANLCEGNQVQNLVIDNSHGINGPYNTFFRNRIELYGIVMNSNPASDRQNFVGNEITNSGAFMGNYLLAGSGHFEYSNNQKGKRVPAQTGDLPEASLYRKTPPPYYGVQEAWPSMGPPHALNAHPLLAAVRWAEGGHTACDVETPVTHRETLPAPRLVLYPNPVRDRLQWRWPSSAPASVRSVEVYGTTGQLLLSAPYTTSLDVSHLPAGLYRLVVTRTDGRRYHQPFIRQGN
ncbi:Por secretion system C-terminal sorting domain-containing protein [Catalinimonas alkaloidigena]|uniref:Por secretion system C-terminal sorting domain-containing protein n=2 Tax=Catalinimonas alkaloidigena TaxID=1075417 RepID=A0A1G9UDR6_9BACT|nr:Por secretion system C-terminal sorting domain-containing protein [Catalinimonas alkaloidigena]